MTPTVSLPYDNVNDNMDKRVCKNEKIEGTDYLVMGSLFSNDAGLMYRYTMSDYNFESAIIGINMRAIASHSSSTFITGSGGRINSITSKPLTKRFIVDHSKLSDGLITQIDLYTTDTSKFERDVLMTNGNDTFMNTAVFFH